ncbi:MAG: methyltransferase domain-containing protein [Gammaproteobacteria bacterium]|nr:methyltransferase domain-containing protein [Gammaproteobacteria bacterium]
MNIIPAYNLACPIDKLELVKKENYYQCTNGHCFDIAKQGYVNLLPVQHKKSKNPGDSKAMVQARTRFLNAGFYLPIAEQLSKIVLHQLGNTATESRCVFDAGCGEGYYLQQIINAAQYIDNNTQFSFVAMDISKPAIINASKRSKQVSWIVGTNSQPPFMPETVDLIFCVFGFPSYNGFKKILKAGGELILVEPGAKHLQELREIIYTEAAQEKSENKSDANTEYLLIDTQTLTYEINLNNNSQIQDLLTMTPHLFRASSEGKACIENMDSLSLTTDIIFRVFKYNPVSNYP